MAGRAYSMYGGFVDIVVWFWRYAHYDGILRFSLFFLINGTAPFKIGSREGNWRFVSKNLHDVPLLSGDALEIYHNENH